jgi:hypothetical protein
MQSPDFFAARPYPCGGAKPLRRDSQYFQEVIAAGKARFCLEREACRRAFADFDLLERRKIFSREMNWCERSRRFRKQDWTKRQPSWREVLGMQAILRPTGTTEYSHSSAQHGPRTPTGTQKASARASLSSAIWADGKIADAFTELGAWLTPVRHPGSIYHHASEGTVGVRHPREILALLNVVTKEGATWVANELKTCLDQIRLGDERLTATVEFRRLEELVRRYGH